MATPESLVYHGQEGTGAARIFGKEGNPFRALQNRYAQEEQRKAVEAAEKAKAKQERDKKMADLLNVDPEKTYQPFNEQVLKEAQNHRQTIIDYFEKGGDPMDPKFIMSNKNGWDRVNNVARKGEYIKSKVAESREMIKADPFLDQRYYNDKINDIYMDEYGNGKPIDQVDVNQIEQIANDTGGFKRDAYMEHFVKNIKNNVVNFIKQRNIAEGLETRDIEIKLLDKIYTPDPEDPSGIKRNPDGTPMINITPDVKQAVLSNPLAKRAFEEDAAKTGQTVDEVIKNWIELKGPQSEKHTQVSVSRSPEWYQEQMYAAANGVSPREVPLYTRRWQNINSAINAFTNPDGSRRTDPTPEAKVALGYLKKNMKVGGGDVLDAVFVPGTNTPGVSNQAGMQVENNPNDRIIFKVKHGTRGFAQPIEINLADEGAGAELNSLYEMAKTEGKVNISFDKLLQMNSVSPADVYKGRAGLTKQNEMSKERENEVVGAWQKGEGLDQLKDRAYNGKRIISAQKIKTDPGYMGGLWGEKHAIELQVESGDPLNPIEYANVPMDKYDELAKIFKGESTAPTQVKTQPPKVKTIKRTDLASKAQAAGYTVKEYEELLKKNGVTIQ